MTISTELRKAGPFTGNGATTAFPFSFKVFAATDVTATRADTLGAETGLVLNTDFTVALNADQDAAPGGTVTLAAPLSTGYRLVVSSAVPNLQPTDITNNGGFYPRVIEDALDRHVAQIQQIDEKVDRALKVAVTSPLGDQALPSPVAGMLIGWNESNDGLKNYAPIGGTLLGQQLAAANGSSLVGFQQSGTGSVLRTAQDKMRESVSVKDFIPVGTDTANTNCAPYINAAYAAARTLGVKVVFWPSATYKITNQIDATGVSTQGDNATLLGVLSSAVSNAAFQWGGDDCYVTGMVFDLSNTNAALEMQGVLNGTNNASRQRFFNNTIISRTSKASGASSIYGLWCMGTGLSGLYVYGNTFNATSYGFQLNNQDAAGRDVNTNPLGNPTYDVFAYDNEFIDASLGINTPHIFCNNVQLHNNTFRQINKTMDLPLNIAHVSGLVVSGNIVACNSASANGAIHIEDVSQDATVTGNVVRLSAVNSGIFISNQSGVSQDAQPGRKVVVTGNHCYSSSSSGDAAGIGYFDVQASGCRISGNHIQSFARGVDIVGKHSVSDNTLQDCGIGIVFSDDSNGVSLDNVFVNCTTVARGANGATTVIQGGQIRADTFEFTKTNNNIYLLSNVTFRRDSNTTLAANTPFTICPLPASYKFDGSVNILFSSGLGFSKNNINFNGTTFTYTRAADAQVASLGGLTLTKSGAELQASSSIASGTTRIAVQIDGLVY